MHNEIPCPMRLLRVLMPLTVTHIAMLPSYLYY